MDAIRFFFSFKGRINRAKNWLYTLFYFAWVVAMEIVALVGLDWTATAKSFDAAYDEGKEIFDPAKLVWPQIDTLTAKITMAVLVAMLLLLTYTSLAVFVKRLHDRNKNAWWLIPYWVLPSLLSLYAMKTATPIWLGDMTFAGTIANGIGTLITLWVFIELWCLRGTKGSNRFGVDPLAKGPVFCEPGKPVYGCVPKP